MASVSDTKYSFETEWFDATAQLIRTFILSYYKDDGTLELYDPKGRKMFLKRSKYEAVALEDLVVGSTVSIYARQLKIMRYADDFTANALAAKREKTLALIKPDAYGQMGAIIDAIYEAGFVVSRMRMFALRPEEARRFYADQAGKAHFGDLVEVMTSDACVGLELVGDGAIAKWRRLMGPADVDDAKRTAPGSLRALYGHGGAANAVHGSVNRHAARRELDFFFGPNTALPQTAVLDNCTVCVVKPHAVLMGLAGKVLDAILAEGFEVSAMEMFALDTVNAEEFLEIYKGVVPEYKGMVEQLVSGPCLAVEVRGENAVTRFREFCGPADPEIASRIRPNSLRARFGTDKLKNAVHCTDLPEDGTLESEYFFRILQ